MNGILFFAGMVVLTAAFFSYGHPLLRRIGVLCVGLTTFAAGYIATRSVWVGVAALSVWLLLPWVEILLRVRKLRLPLNKRLLSAPPPPRDMFPVLDELTEEIEGCGFEHVADLGWEMDGYRQFLRLFAHPGKNTEAAVTYVEQSQLGFHFCSATSRGADGSVFMTWNCPVSSSLRTPPAVHVNRVVTEGSFEELVASHEKFLGRSGAMAGGLQSVDPGQVRASVERDMDVQMQHNVRVGMLHDDGEGNGRYSWRGMLYLWFQFLRDLFRFS